VFAVRSLILWCTVLASLSVCCAQTAPVLLGADNFSPFPLSVAPGQLLTLFVQPAAAVSPVSSSSVTASYSGQPMAVLRIAPLSTACNAPLPNGSQCAQVLAVTVQVPFEIGVICGLCESPIVASGQIVVSVNGVGAASVGVQPLQDQVHFLTACDVIVAGTSSSRPLNGLPCAPVITHANGQTVSNLLPANAGEELVAYAIGLGATSPALATGQPASQTVPTVTTFNIDFNYRVNALATQPGAVGSQTAPPLFTGATQGFVGLYQINFIVPPPPPGLTPCVNNATIALGGIAVASNLTVSVGSAYSFDGAGICVAPAP
jgi:uncharacterized protein (TIGR03437 family)